MNRSASLAIVAALLATTGCTVSHRNIDATSLASSSANNRSTNIFADAALMTTLAEGSLSVTRTAPVAIMIDERNLALVSPSEHSLENTSAPTSNSIVGIPMIGLVPGSVPALLAPRIEPVGAWLSINTKDRTLSVMESGEIVFSAPFAGGAPSVSPNDALSVLLKQRNAVWFAPDEYYAARDLTPPSQTSRDRYLKGALGDFVVYLAEDFAIYSGPVDVPEISGIRLDPSDLARIYYLLPVGSKVLAN